MGKYMTSISMYITEFNIGVQILKYEKGGF